MNESISKGTRAEILTAIKANGSVWVKGAARETVRKMAKAGLVNYFPQAICDNRTSRSHEEYHVMLSERENRK